MQATARRLSVVSTTSCARRRLIRSIRLIQHATRQFMKTVFDRMVSVGCLLLLAAFVAAIVWTFIAGWNHSIWIGITLGLGLLLGQYSSYRLRRAVQAMIDSAFLSRGLQSPTFTQAGSYGYPGYRLSFPNKVAEQVAQSSGALSAFKANIQDYHRDDGSKSRPFDVSLAVHTTYPNKPPF